MAEFLPAPKQRLPGTGRGGGKSQGRDTSPSWGRRRPSCSQGAQGHGLASAYSQLSANPSLTGPSLPSGTVFLSSSLSAS